MTPVIPCKSWLTVYSMPTITDEPKVNVVIRPSPLLMKDYPESRLSSACHCISPPYITKTVTKFVEGLTDSAPLGDAVVVAASETEALDATGSLLTSESATGARVLKHEMSGSEKSGKNRTL